MRSFAIVDHIDDEMELSFRIASQCGMFNLSLFFVVLHALAIGLAIVPFHGVMMDSDPPHTRGHAGAGSSEFVRRCQKRYQLPFSVRPCACFPLGLLVTVRSEERARTWRGHHSMLPAKAVLVIACASSWMRRKWSLPRKLSA